MFDRDYQLVRMTMREREREACLQRLARGERPERRNPLWQALMKVLERDGTVACADTGLVHRPWSDTSR
jgi:hypothetical protein